MESGGTESLPWLPREPRPEDGEPGAMGQVPIPVETLPPLPPLRLAVVGHVEVVSFLEVQQMPQPGIVQRALAFSEHAAGGAAVVAVQLARLSQSRVDLYTALGRDSHGQRAASELESLGVDVHVAWRDSPTRRGVSFIEAGGDRSITVIGERLTPYGNDALPWEELRKCDGVFVTAADPSALRAARQARVCTATPRVGLDVLNQSGIALDALIGSGLDPAEQVPDHALRASPHLVIATHGAAGGIARPGGRFAAPLRSTPERDSYGAGDCFAAGVTAGLAAGWNIQQAISLGCHCGSCCLDALGPYASQYRRPSES
jgi:ribokinase